MFLALTIATLTLLALQVVGVMILSATRLIGNVYVTIVVVCAATAPIAFVAGARLLGAPVTVDARIFLVVIHAALGGLFFQFMTLPDRSVTLRVLVELLLAPGHTLSTEALKRQYSVETMIGSRLEQLSAGGFLEITPGGAIELTAKGRMFGRFVTAGRALFRIESAN